VTSSSTPGWYSDPTGKYASRYWDGQQWTSHVSSGGANAVDEPPAEMRFLVPAPGTETHAAAQPSPVQITQQAPRSSVGTVIATVLGIIAILVVVFVLLNQNGDSGTTDTPTEPPATTSAPADPSDG
jgi:hypothetical protein